eukprot:TRINITY_DN1095_c0_g1_i1.p1 TRINITY_DN1095_c0_g1~~TRINITY_DN1095_c0_g1_i1.p1  ORF type:complete len:136 (-),score=25.88 TRINITY_DN1095_c0_g1_i1:424-831(-)
MSSEAVATQRKQLQISFDEFNQIRLLDAESFKQTEQLSNECSTFSDKIESFNKIVNSLLDVLTSQSQKIERQKLMAIGQRNRITVETDTRKRKQQELQYMISQKQAELQRLTDYLDSLTKVEQEQKTVIEKLSKN